FDCIATSGTASLIAGTEVRSKHSLARRFAGRPRGSIYCAVGETSQQISGVADPQLRGQKRRLRCDDRIHIVLEPMSANRRIRQEPGLLPVRATAAAL